MLMIETRFLQQRTDYSLFKFSIGMTQVPKHKFTIFQITGPSISRQSSSIEDGTGSSSQHFDAKGRKILSRVESGGQVKRWSFVTAIEASSNI